MGLSKIHPFLIKISNVKKDPNHHRKFQHDLLSTSICILLIFEVQKKFAEIRKKRQPS